MKFTLESATAVTVRSVSDHEIRIGEQTHQDTIAVTTEGVLEGWESRPLESLTGDDFESLLQAGPELVVVGTGSRHKNPPRDLTFAFARRGVGLEVMDTRAAARTFNVLVGEGRKVAAVFYISG